MADTPAQAGATTTLGYLADRSAQLAASLREVEAEILKGQGATSLADASRGSHARVARLRANLRETLQPLLDEAEGEGLRGDIAKVGDEVRASEKRVAALEKVVECEASIDGAEAELGAGRVVEACAASILTACKRSGSSVPSTTLVATMTRDMRCIWDCSAAARTDGRNHSSATALRSSSNCGSESMLITLHHSFTKPSMPISQAMKIKAGDGSP